MPYVSAKYQLPGPIPMPEGSPRSVQAVDDQGQVWSLTEDSQVGDWLRYLEEGGTIDDPDGVLTGKTVPPEPIPPVAKTGPVYETYANQTVPDVQQDAFDDTGPEPAA